MARMIDLAGQRFNKLIALYSISGPRGRLWICTVWDSNTLWPFERKG